MNERMNERMNELAEFFLVPWSQYSSSGISRCVYLYVEIGMMQGYKL